MENQRRVRAAAAIIGLYGVLCAGCGQWAPPAAAGLLAAGVAAGSRTARLLAFGVAAFLGGFGAFGLTRYGLHAAGVLLPVKAPVSAGWLAYFAGFSAVSLALAALLAPRRADLSPASPCP